jgi:hypothetical protein
MSFKIPEQYLSDATIPASNAGLVVELQQIEKVHWRLPIEAKRDMTCFNPNNFRFNMSIEAYNICFKRRDKDLSNAIIPTSITRLVVETQRLGKGISKVATPINLFLDTISFRGNQIKNPELLWQKVAMKTFWNLFVLF